MQKIRDVILEMWKPNNVRSRYGEFKPNFLDVIGSDDEREYNNLCRTIQDSVTPETILVDGGLKFAPKVEVLREIKKDLPHMDLTDINSADLILFSDPALNQLYLNALNYTTKAAIREGRIKDRKRQENFVCNQIVFSIEYLMNVRFSNEVCPKIVYYNASEVEERDFWFLMLCYVMGFDVIVLEPTRESDAFLLDADHLIETIRMPKLSSRLSFAERAAKGTKMNVVRTTSATLSRQIGESLYQDTGVFRPWTFRNGKLEHVLIDGNLADLEYTWKSEARMREGFGTSGDTIRVPSFFIEIDGVDRDRNAYFRLIDNCIKTEKTIFDKQGGRTLLLPLKPKSEMVRLVFAMNPSGFFEYEKLRDMPDSMLQKVSPETGKRIVEKLNELIRNAKKPMTKDERVRAANIVLSMSASVIRLLENYDFPFFVPKIVLFLEDEEKIDPDVQLLLQFLSNYAFDIAVFAPAGFSGLQNDHRTVIRLDDMIYNFRFPQEQPEDSSLLGSLRRFFGAD